MKDLIVFNHHSAPYNSRKEAIDPSTGFIVFLKSLKLLKKYGFSVLLLEEHIDKSLMQLELSNNYRVSDWCKDRDVASRSDWSRFLKNINTRQPFIQNEVQQSKSLEVEIGLIDSNDSLSALVAAYIHETFIISLITKDIWKSNTIHAWMAYLDDTIGESVVRTEITFKNISSESSIEHFREELLSNKCSTEDNPGKKAKELWGHRGIYFESLKFVECSLQSTFMKWSFPESVLDAVESSLNLLDTYAAKIKDGVYLFYRKEQLYELGLSYKVSGESESIRKDPKAREKRSFYIETGEKIFFEDHIKLPLGYRLYFYADFDDKSIYIGYIDVHP